MLSNTIIFSNGIILSWIERRRSALADTYHFNQVLQIIISMNLIVWLGNLSIHAYLLTYSQTIFGSQFTIHHPCYVSPYNTYLENNHRVANSFLHKNCIFDSLFYLAHLFGECWWTLVISSFKVKHCFTQKIFGQIAQKAEHQSGNPMVEILIHFN